VGLAGDDGPKQTRSNLSQKEIPVQFGIQAALTEMDIDVIDDWIETEEQIRDHLRKTFDHASYSWMRTDAIRDESGLPLTYAGLRETLMFETYFTTYFRYVLQP